MQSQEIVKLTRKRIQAVLKNRRAATFTPENAPAGAERRRSPRWPFNGAIEIWPQDTGQRSTIHGTCLNLSETGVGLSCDQHLSLGDSLEVAIHLPEVTVCGRAIVRYCAEVRGEFMVGMEFQF